MKKLFFIACFFLVIKVTAQGNLQFNQVINGQLTATVPNTSGGVIMGTIIVPTGKVLKIESASFMIAAGSFIYMADNAAISINNHIVYGFQNDRVNFPVWLSAGSYNVRAVIATSNSSLLRTFSYSAIEFNIVP